MIVTLESSAGTVTIGDGSNSLCIAAHDLGYAEHRETVSPRPDASGVFDTTRYSGARVMTFQIRSYPFSAADLAALAAFTRPQLRPVLTITDPSLPTVMRAEVRMLPFSDNAEVATYVAGVRELIVQAIVATGVLESAELHQTTVPATGETEPGFEFDLSFDLSFGGDEPPVGSVDVVNAGNAESDPLIHLYGPWSGETVVENMTTGLKLVFDGESVADGNFLEVDFRNRTILLDGDPSNLRYHRMVPEDSDWWTLVPGTNVLRFAPETFSSPARMIVAWRDAWA